MPHRLTLHELIDRLSRRECSAREATQACLDQVQRLEPQLGAFLAVNAREALAQADAADAAWRRGEYGPDRPLLGVPMALKDIIAERGQQLTCGSRILENFKAPYDATVVTKLRQAGAILLGRLNLDEFAMGSSTENSGYQLTRNPWDLERIPGGSSGGSAAAVASREVMAALGSDTGGSVRQPAALCGVTGLKPSYGRVSRYGLVAYASSLDQIGCITRDVQDAATLLGVVAGHDPLDSTSVARPVPDYRSALQGDLRGIRLGRPREYMLAGVDPEVQRAVDAAVARLQELGAEVVDLSLPHTEYAIATYYVIAPAEASANLARFDGVRYGMRVDGADPAQMYARTRGTGFGAEVKRRIILGTYVLSSGYYDAYYLRAQRVRALIRQDFLKAFEQVDAIVTPTTPTAAFRIGEKASDPLQMYLEDIFTISANLAGICGLSVPCGFTASPRLPVGLQFLGKPLGEADLLRIAYAYQQATDWHRACPPLANAGAGPRSRDAAGPRAGLPTG